MGTTQAALSERPPALGPQVGVTLRAQCVQIAGAEEYRMVYQNGAYRDALVNGMLRFVNQSHVGGCLAMPRVGIRSHTAGRPGAWLPSFH